LLISAVIADARNFSNSVNCRNLRAALPTRTVMTTVPTTDALSLLPSGHGPTYFINDARPFVSWNAGILDPGPQALFRKHVTVAEAARKPGPLSLLIPQLPSLP
jgi:hypothetical protein